MWTPAEINQRTTSTHRKKKSVYFKTLQHFKIQSLMAYQLMFDMFKHTNKYTNAAFSKFSAS